MTTDSYIPPSVPVVIDNFFADRHKLKAPCRVTLRGWIIDIDPNVSITNSGKTMLKFYLMDRYGNYIHCAGVGTNADDATIVDSNDVVLYFGSARPAIGNMSATVYAYDDAQIICASEEKPTVRKTRAVEL